MALANVSRPMGFIPLTTAVKGAIVVRSRPIPAVRQASGGGNASTDIAIGDAIAIDANGNAFRAGPNDAVRGICVGLRFLGDPNTMKGQGPISLEYITGTGNQAGTTTIAQALVAEDPDAWFEVQSDTFAASNVGGKFNLADAAPDSTYAQSRQTINIGGGLGAQFQAQDIKQSPADNGYGANARVVVRLLQTFNN